MHRAPHRPAAGQGSLRSYSLGFGLSVGLTLAAYLLVSQQAAAGTVLIAAIMGLAVTQLLVQLIFFLHLGREPRPRWNLLVFLFMLLVLIIVVIGTLWIMYNLDYHMMPPDELDHTIMEDEGIRR